MIIHFCFQLDAVLRLWKCFKDWKKRTQEKQEQIEWMGQIQDLQQMVQGPIQSGTIWISIKKNAVFSTL